MSKYVAPVLMAPFTMGASLLTSLMPSVKGTDAPPLTPLPPVPTVATAPVEDAALAEKNRLLAARGKGLAGLLLTGGQGVLQAPTVGKATLFGG